MFLKVRSCSVKEDREVVSVNWPAQEQYSVILPSFTCVV